MKEREEKPYDNDKVGRCIGLIQQLILLNDGDDVYDHALWVAAMMAIVVDGFEKGRVKNEVFSEYLNKYIDFYKEKSKEWETK